MCARREKIRAVVGCASGLAAAVGEEVLLELEGPDETITLQRAAVIAGLALHTLSDAARGGRLKATRPGHDWLTTRRDLHRYLRGRSRGVVKPLPPSYRTPEGEESIAAGRPMPRADAGMRSDRRAAERLPSPIVTATAGRLARALRTFPELAAILSEHDIATLKEAAKILERIAGAAVGHNQSRSGAVRRPRK